MDFRLTSEQEQFRDSVRRFAGKHLAKGARERAHSPDYPWDVAKLMAAQGLLGITIAEADGGQGGALIDAVIAIVTVASVCPRSADVVQAGNFGPIRVLAEYGTPEQKQKYLKRLLAGESIISVGMTEPEAGSAVTDLQTTATPEGLSRVCATPMQFNSPGLSTPNSPTEPWEINFLAIRLSGKNLSQHQVPISNPTSTPARIRLPV